MLVVGETPVNKSRVANLFARKSAATTFTTADKVADLKDAAFDDVVYFGANPGTVAKLFPKVGVRRSVQPGPVRRQVWPRGRVTGRSRSLRRHPRHRHDRLRPGGRRWRPFPPRRKSVPNDKINVIGAAGPMGTMHVIRDLCQGVPGVTVFAGDLSDERLADASEAGRHRWPRRTSSRCARTIRPRTNSPSSSITSSSWRRCRRWWSQAVAGGRPAGHHQHLRRHPGRQVTAELDLDAYIAKQLYFIGTSGSTLDDMKLVLAKVVGAPARHQSLRRRRVRAGWRDRRHPGGGKKPDARQNPRLSVLPRTEADAVDGAGWQAPAATTVAGTNQAEEALVKQSPKTEHEHESPEQSRHRYRWRARTRPGHFPAAGPRRLPRWSLPT